MPHCRRKSTPTSRMFCIMGTPCGSSWGLPGAPPRGPPHDGPKRCNFYVEVTTTADTFWGPVIFLPLGLPGAPSRGPPHDGPKTCNFNVEATTTTDTFWCPVIFLALPWEAFGSSWKPSGAIGSPGEAFRIASRFSHKDLLGLPRDLRIAHRASRGNVNLGGCWPLRPRVGSNRHAGLMLDNDQRSTDMPSSRRDDAILTATCKPRRELHTTLGSRRPKP